MSPPHVLLIDNYDSFTYNLYQYLCELGARVTVARNDTITVADARELKPDFIVISPGPGRPRDAGVSIELIQQLGPHTPTLGVCLGHQAIAVAHGATVSRAPELLHGKTSEVVHRHGGVLHPLPSPFTVTRYHSLAVEAETLPHELQVTGRTPGGVVMALRHRDKAVEGVQFHPESVLTQGGHLLLAAWLNQCGDTRAMELAPALAARVEEKRLSAFA